MLVAWNENERQKSIDYACTYQNVRKGSFVIKDEPPFMADIYNLIKSDPKAVMFSFGGIGATPDDYTRKVAADVFTDGKMEVNLKPS